MKSFAILAATTAALVSCSDAMDDEGLSLLQLRASSKSVKSKRGNVNCGFSADACKMECEKQGKTFGVATPRPNGKNGWPGVGDYAGVGCYTYTPRMARFLGAETANSCVYGIMDSGKHPESDAELASTHVAWRRFGPGTGGRQLYVRLPNTFGNPHGVSHCEDLEEPTDPDPTDSENEEEAEEEAKQELEEEDQAAATGDPHMTTNTGDHYDLSLLGRGDAVDWGNRGNVNCGFSADACQMECEKQGKTFGVATPRPNGKNGWPGVGDYAGVGCYTYTPRMARFLGAETANSCVYGVMDSGKHPESDAELASTHVAWARFGPGTGGRQLYVRLPNTFGNPHGVSHCEDLEEPTDPDPTDSENE